MNLTQCCGGCHTLLQWAVNVMSSFDAAPTATRRQMMLSVADAFAALSVNRCVLSRVPVGLVACYNGSTPATHLFTFHISAHHCDPARVFPP